MTVAPSVLHERERYARIAASMAHPDPSALVHEFRGRTERFSPARLAGDWAAAARDPRRDQARWNLYVHVPYCKSICTFCNYKRLRPSSKDALDQYVDSIAAEAKLFAPSLDGIRLGGLFVGGGTPSVLSAPQLERLLGALGKCFAFHPDAQKNFEYDPMVMTEERFRVLDRFGFTRYSFGIQSLEADVNTRHNRGAQDRRHVARQFDLLRRHGARKVNVDFLLGLDGTTPEGMVAEIEEVLARDRPDEVSVYFLAPTTEYVARHFGGDFARFETFLRPFEERVPPTLRRAAERTGYVVSGDGRHILDLQLVEHARTPEADRDRALFYCDVPSQVHRPLHVLGLGDSARSRIFGRLLYRAEHDTDDRDPDSPRYVGVRLTPKDEMFGYVAFVLRDGDALDRARFRRTFGRDVTEVYPDALDKLATLGACVVRDDAVVFAPQDRRERLRDILFFMAPDRLDAIAPHAPRLHAEPRGAAPPAAGPPADEIRRLIQPFVERGALPGGWRIAEVSAVGVAIVRAAPPARMLMRLLAPAGGRPAYRSTARFDVQYEVRDGHPTAADLDPPLLSLVHAVRANET